MAKFKITLAQLNFCVGDIEGNKRKIIDTIESLEGRTDLIVFPELALCGYPPEDLLHRQEFQDRCDTALETLRELSRDTAILVGHPTRNDNRLYNSASLLHEQTCLATYHKQCLPNYSVFDEMRYFTPGTQTKVLNHKNIKFGILICEDLWQKEPTESIKDAGADIIICINASPFAKNKRWQREALIKKRCDESGLPIVYVNCVGGQDELVFDGHSASYSADGRCCQTSPLFQESLNTVVFDLKLKNFTPPYPLKIDTPRQELADIYDALVLGIRDYVNKNRFPGVIIGLSGGIDSALVLALACDALGSDKVDAIAMPSRYTASMSNGDARTMANELKVSFELIPIEPVFASYLELFDHNFSDLDQSIAQENIQARIRGNILMAKSNMSGKIVLTTGNKSELSVGYCTLYGDMAGGFAPIKDIPKMDVYALAEYRNTISPVIPTNIIERAPSAELRSDQKDEDSLPPYPILDRIIELYVNQEQSREDIISEGIDPQEVDHIIRLIKRNEYKRRQAPIGIRIRTQAYGKDRRYPITSTF